jgi:hypothetical protein
MDDEEGRTRYAGTHSTNQSFVVNGRSQGEIDCYWKRLCRSGSEIHDYGPLVYVP